MAEQETTAEAGKCDAGDGTPVESTDYDGGEKKEASEAKSLLSSTKEAISTNSEIEKYQNNNKTRINRASIAALDLPKPSKKITNSKPIELPKHLLQLEEKENSLNNKKSYGLILKDDEKSGFMERRHSDGMIITTRMASLELLEPLETKIKSEPNDKVNIKSHEVIIPSRDALTKMPFFTTPLTLEATNNAYRDFYKRLNEMGFSEQAEAAIVHTDAESVELAIEFILSHPNGLWHRFVPSQTTVISKENEPCNACSIIYSKHLIDSKGEKIKQLDEIILDDEDDDDILPVINITNNGINIRDNNKEIKKIEKEEIKENKNEYKGVTKTCGVCLEDLPEYEFYKAPCKHDYCKKCLEQHYRIKTKDGDVLKLSCIDPDCDREILEDEIKSFLTDQVLLDKFKKFKREKLVMLNPNARFCCKPDCEGYMIGSRFKPKLKCPICSTFVCYNCSSKWHGYLVGCNANTDMGYAKWALNKDVQKCPKCRVRIEKSDGCNHMTCWSCKHEFCWICKGPYNDAHFAWWNILGCPGGQDTPTFCRCPPCFPSWMNRLIILMCFLGFVVPLAVTAGIIWMLLLCLVFCIRCDLKCDANPCNIFD